MAGEIGALNSGDAKWHKVGGVQVFARRDDRGRPTKADAIDQNDDAIRKIADQLQRRRLRCASRASSSCRSCFSPPSGALGGSWRAAGKSLRHLGGVTIHEVETDP